jgi:hypothetical protein
VAVARETTHFSGEHEKAGRNRMKIKCALIVDNLSISDWQNSALGFASDCLNIKLILNCTNTNLQRLYLRHFAYYVLNIISLKNRQTRRVPCSIAGAAVINFESGYNGSWQTIPVTVARVVKSMDIKLVIKFGMSLLKIDDSISDLDILSFHHGDPERYRGRPAGFYELYNNDKAVGTVVQKISNKLDAGKILTRAYSRAYRHSYKKTVEHSFLLSKFLLRKAVENYVSDQTVTLNKIGPSYTLPSNTTVIKFAFKLFNSKISRLLYGLFYEKRWNIVLLEIDYLHNDLVLSVGKGASPLVRSGYRFYADPFFSAAGDKIRTEALNARNGLGEIIELQANNFCASVQPLVKGGHYSYPCSFKDDDREYICPEVASHSAPYLLPEPFDGKTKEYLKGLENIKALDGTILKHDNVYYFFCGLKHSSEECLYLYFSDKLNGPYKSHPKNPIVIDPSSARMGGKILRWGEKLYRFGQNNCYDYGNGITVSEIECLSKEHYSERKAASISFADAHGPHTLDISGNLAVLDFYSNQMSFGAAYRRVATKYLR